MAPASSNAPVLAGVVGHPVRHSLSPVIHTIWAKRAGINGYYIPIDVPPSYDEFARAMDSLRVVGFAGVNVTLPHKEHALRYADKKSENAQAAGAANMLTFSDAGASAENSDTTGFAEAVREQRSEPGISALVLGAGGAARGVVLALKALGFTDIRIANRTMERAVALAEAFDLAVIEWGKRSQVLENTDILVNTTSLGMSGQPSLEMEIGALKPSALIADIVYAPLKTDLLRRAEENSHQTVDGLAMLMHQAVPGFRQWFGEEASVDDELRGELVKELNRRGKT